MGGRATVLSLVVLACVPVAQAQAPSARRLATVHALKQFPGFFHLQNVLLRGEFVDDGARLVLRADGEDLRALLADDVRSASGSVEVRGQLIDVGRLEPDDPRVTQYTEGRDAERWPRPGEELFLRVTAVTPAPAVIGLGVRDLALEPWRYEGQKITVVGNFRGRNLFGDLPGAPNRSRYDFVLRGAEGAVWVTEMRPRGRGFDLDIDRRFDTDKWLEVAGTLVHERGLVRIEATQLTLAKAPELTSAVEEPAAPAAPPPPLEVVFSSPTDQEIDISRTAPVRIQFGRGLDLKSLAGSIRVTYAGAPPGAAPPAFETTYDAGTRALTLRFAEPLEPLRTVRIEVLDTLKAFDGGTATPWTLTFTVAG